MLKIIAAALLAVPLVAAAQGPQEPVRNLLVRLKPAAESTASAREAPQAARERLRAVAATAGVGFEDERAVGRQHRLLRMPAAQSGAELDATVRRLRLNPDVLDVEPDVRVRRLAVPSDPDYARQWQLQPPTTDAAAMNMPAAWDVTTGSASVVVAVLDVGVRLNHPDLTGRLVAGYDFVSEVEYSNDGNGRDADPSDPGDWVNAADKRSPLFSTCDIEDSSWHGTFIAGQIAAATNNGLGVAGIDWQARVLPVRIAGKCGALLSDLLDGMRWAAGLTVAGAPANATPARILNLSFGGDAACSPSYQDVIDEITEAGALLVVAAGNEAGTVARPADCAGVLAVGAVQEDGRKTAYSNYGAQIGIVAPGGTGTRAIYSLDNQGTTTPGVDTYGLKLGTSFSSPQAAGVAALMLAVNPALTPAQLVVRMQDAARPHVAVAGALRCSTNGTVPCNCDTSTCGAGLLDGARAVLAATSSLVPQAVAAPVATAPAGNAVPLNGNASTASTGAAIVTYRWAQVSGPATATIANPGSANTSATLPVAGAYVFSLTVTDNAGRRDVANLAVTASTSSSGGGGGGGGGGGASSWWWGAALWALALLAWRRRA
ncbi:S8 family peptidase [Pseudorhodoferax soli]|uniref:Peptidase MprA n=1 Tax=Pseudorhodoferax soli TaxID=545864 RepID=A0A368X990_9BURK|nr:S8 family peptidase [Pseudorhodoferax soli]RCW64415.1 peptidase MprA [Pseudorhodoferax soli]